MEQVNRTVSWKWRCCWRHHVMDRSHRIALALPRDASDAMGSGVKQKL